jgi:hypothetical protein
VSTYVDIKKAVSRAILEDFDPSMPIRDILKNVWLSMFVHISNNRDKFQFNPNDGNRLNATWLGHSSLMINLDGYRILTDPVFEKRISILGPTRYAGDLPIRIDQLPPIDAVIISHDHYDHLNKWSIQQLAAKTDTFIVPLAVGAYLVKWGVKQERIVELDWCLFHRKLLFKSVPVDRQPIIWFNPCHG